MDSAENRGAIIFDFDGTIADSFPVALEIFYLLTHTNPLPDEDMSRLRGMSLIQVAKELRIPMYAVPFLVIRGRKIMRKRMSQVELIQGMDEVIRKLHGQYKLFILSSNSPKNIGLMLSRYDLASYFSGVHGNVSLLGKSRKLRQVMKHYQLNSDTTWYVGDEARDMEAAQNTHVKSVAVSWGYNNIHVLKECQPDILVFTPDELLSCFYNNTI